MNNESKLREALEGIIAESLTTDSEEVRPGVFSSWGVFKKEGIDKIMKLLATTPIENEKGNEQIAIHISEEWNTDADLRLLIKNALDAKDSTHALEKERLEREVAELKGIRTNAIKFLDTELCDAHFQESKSQPFDDFHKAQKDAGCRMCLKSKLASQSSQIKELVTFVQRIANDASSTMSFEMIECEAKQALARFKGGSK